MPVIAALGRLRQKNHKCKASLGYTVSKQTSKQNNHSVQRLRSSVVSMLEVLVQSLAPKKKKTHVHAH
jgi:hypothetical protein